MKDKQFDDSRQFDRGKVQRPAVIHVPADRERSRRDLHAGHERLAINFNMCDAARMIGHARSAYQACGMAIEGSTLRNLERAERLARSSLDDTTFTVRVAEGRRLDDAAADRLALGPAEVLASRAEESSPRP
jgi:hypothetical protein